ncbi:MAG: HAD-IA family hydrolase [Candidatus Dormiibacterota bacterium]
MDGVLLDSEATYRVVWARWAEGLGLDSVHLWPRLAGRRASDTIAEVAPHLDPLEEVVKLRALLLEEQAALPAMPGAHELLAALEGGSWALVTSNEEGVIREQFERLRLPRPGVVVGGSAVLHGKPDPACFTAAAERLGAAFEDCLVVEDSPAGVAAGRAAGMTVLALETTHRAELLSGAHRVVATLQDAAPTIRGWVAGD